jgi:glycosyltransferase involved in cell wall biosynthesis
MKRLKICFVSLHGSPEFLGGGNLFHKNLINYIYSKHNNIKISWVYSGEENRRYHKDNVEYIELKSNKFQSPLLLRENFALAKFFKKNYFDVINTLTGMWTYFYNKKEKQKIIQTFHGTIYYFNKNHIGRLSPIRKILMIPLLAISWLVGLPNKKNTDTIICVSEKVKRQVNKLYGKMKNVIFIRTGVDLKSFRIRNKNKIKEKISLNKEGIYGLYVGRGGYWTKGLDRVIKLSKEIYKLNKNYKLIIIGADYKKVKHLLNEKFIIYFEKIEREKIPFYYNASDIFFCLSRYEGGAPTLVVSEAMASGCLAIFSKDSEQEIIEDEKNGLIIENFNENDANKIIRILGDKEKKSVIIKNSIKTIKELSLEKWGEKYLNILRG